MATSKSSSSDRDLGENAHDAEPGFHGHAPYPSREDLEQRLRSAKGEVAPVVEEPLPFPDPAQQ